MIKEIPILFSGGLIQPVMTSLKTMTRRLNGLKLINQDPNKWNFIEVESPFKGADIFWFEGQGERVAIKCPYGKPGDLLWVRETWALAWNQVLYKANERYGKYEDQKWKPSIHMPKKAARIWLQVESIRVERLKDISDIDAIAEGIESYTILDDLIGYKNYSENARKDFLNKSQYQFDNMKEIQSGPIASFCTLWISINGRESWISNPWVWVVSFTVLSVNGKPDLKTT